MRVDTCERACKGEGKEWYNLFLFHTVYNTAHTSIFIHNFRLSVFISFIFYVLHTHTHTHTRLTAFFPGLPGWAGTSKVKPIWILLKQETVSGSGISWSTCKSAPCSRQIATPAPHQSVFLGRMPFLPPNQLRQSTEGNFYVLHAMINANSDTGA